MVKKDIEGQIGDCNKRIIVFPIRLSSRKRNSAAVTISPKGSVTIEPPVHDTNGDILDSNTKKMDNNDNTIETRQQQQMSRTRVKKGKHKKSQRSNKVQPTQEKKKQERVGTNE